MKSLPSTAGGASSGVALGKVTIGGPVSYAQIIAGVSLNTLGSVQQNAQSQIGNVVFTGSSISNLNIVAGVGKGADGVYGTMDDTLLPNSGVPNIVSQIASVTFANQSAITASSVGSIEAANVEKVVLGTTPVALAPGAGKNPYPGVALGSATSFLIFEP